MARNELTPQEINDRKIIAQRLNDFLLESNKKQSDLSKDLKIPASTLNGYFLGTSTPSPGNVQKLADYFNVKKSDIDPRFQQIPSNIIEIREVKSIPLLGAIACGDPILAEENIIERIAFPSELLPGGGEVFFLRAKGKSMEPTIKDASLVLIRKQSAVENNEIAAVLLSDTNEATLKRVKYIGKEIILMPDNDSYEPIILTKENGARILGKAIKTLNDL